MQDEEIQLTIRGDPPGGAPLPARKTWTSCCLTSDRQATVYFGQLSVSFAVLAFCAFVIVKADGNCDRSSAAWGIVSFILGRTLSAVVDSTAS